MKANITVDKVMSRNLKTLHPKDKLIRAKELFEMYDIHHIPVHVMGDVRGIISLGDILFLEGFTKNSFDEFLKAKKFQTMTVDEVMTDHPYCIEHDALISEVVELMTEKRVNALPVHQNSELVGIVTSYDIIEYFGQVLNQVVAE